MSWTKRRSKLLGFDFFYRIGESGARYTVCPRSGFYAKAAGVVVSFGGGIDAYECNGTIKEIPAGAAHYLEHILFKNNGSNLGDIISQRGGECNAETDMNSTSYYFSSTVDFDLNLNSLLDIVFASTIPESVVEQERGIILAEHFETLDSPYWQNHLILRNSLYGPCNLSRDLTGDESSIKLLDTQVLRDIYQIFYAPDNMHFVAVGDLDPEDFYQTVESRAMNLKRKQTSSRRISFVSNCVGSSSIDNAENLALPFLSAGIRFSMPPLNDLKQRTLTKLCLPIGIDLLFGDMSEFMSHAIDEGLAEGTLDTSEYFDIEHGYVAVHAQSFRPEELFKQICKVVEERQKLLNRNKDDVELMRRDIIGKSLFGFSSINSSLAIVLNPIYGNFPPKLFSEDLLATLSSDEVASVLDFCMSQHPVLYSLSLPPDIASHTIRLET